MVLKEYKSTSIGIIPKDWDEFKVADNFTSVANNSLSRDCLNNEGGAYMNVHYGDILVKYGNIITVGKDDIPYVNDDVKLNSTRCLRNGDIIIADTAEDETAGKSVEIQGISDTPVLSGLHTLTIRPSVDFAPKYLGYFFNSGFYHNQLIPYMQGTKVLSISKKSVGETIVAAPSSPDEQKRIATALSDIDTYLTTLEAAIAKKRLLKQGTMQQLLTGKTRLPGFTGPWVDVLLGDILSYEQPGNYLVSSKILEKGLFPVLTAGKTFILGYTNEDYGVFKKLPVIIFDDFTTASQYVNFSFKAKSSAMKLLSVSDISKYNLRFIFEILQTIKYEVTDHERHWIKIFSNILVNIPSSIIEQKAIASVLTDMDDEIAALQREHTKYTLIKQGMMQKLLTGQIRLPQPCQSQE